MERDVGSHPMPKSSRAQKSPQARSVLSDVRNIRPPTFSLTIGMIRHGPTNSWFPLWGVLSIASNACLNCQTTSGNISATFSFKGFVAARATTRIWQLWHLGWNETHFLILRIFLRRLAFGPSYGRRPQDRLQTNTPQACREEAYKRSSTFNP